MTVTHRNFPTGNVHTFEENSFSLKCQKIRTSSIINLKLFSNDVHTLRPDRFSSKEFQGVIFFPCDFFGEMVNWECWKSFEIMCKKVLRRRTGFTSVISLIHKHWKSGQMRNQHLSVASCSFFVHEAIFGSATQNVLLNDNRRGTNANTFRANTGVRACSSEQERTQIFRKILNKNSENSWNIKQKRTRTRIVKIPNTNKCEHDLFRNRRTGTNTNTLFPKTSNTSEKIIGHGEH